MGFSTLAALQTALTKEDRIAILKINTAVVAAGDLTSWWTCPGYPAAGAIPTTAATVDRTTTGAIPFHRPASGKTLMLTRFELSDSASNAIAAKTGAFLYDRLIQSGGLDGNSIATQTVNTPALPARLNDANGVDVECFLECYTTTGAVGVNATVAYTDADAASQTSVVAVPATWRARRLLQVIPANGRGFKSVETVTLSGLTGTSGNFGVTLAHRVCSVTQRRAVHPNWRYGPLDLGLQRFHRDACGWVVWLIGNANALDSYGEIGVVEEG